MRKKVSVNQLDRLSPQVDGSRALAKQFPLRLDPDRIKPQLRCDRGDNGKPAAPLQKTVAQQHLRFANPAKCLVKVTKIGRHELLDLGSVPVVLEGLDSPQIGRDSFLKLIRDEPLIDLRRNS